MSSAGPLLRIARRSLLRDRWRALLIMALIGLPVAGITTAALLVSAGVPTADERATRMIGRADLGAQPYGSAGRAKLAALLPEGAILQAAWRQHDRVMRTQIRPLTDVLLADLDGLAEGMLTVVDGRAPSAIEEVAISAALASDVSAVIGDTLEFEVLGPKLVVGLVEDPRHIRRLIALTAPELAEAQISNPAWLVDLPDGASVEDVANLVASAVQSDDRGEPLFHVMTRESAGAMDDWFFAVILMVGVLALVETGLVAAAAFAVGIRRRQRELGLLGAAGATPRQLAGAILAEGFVAGLMAVGVGLCAGVGLAWLIGLRLDDIVGQRAGAVDVEPLALLVAGVVGLVATLVAALVPAWGAGRQPTLLSLSGRRPPTTPAKRLLLLGLVLIAVAVVCTLGAALLPGGGGPILPMVVLIVGSVTGVLGFGACSPWLLERLDGPARRLPLAARVAFRDTARYRTRSGPIVVAVLASVASTIAIAAVLDSQRAQAEAWWRPSVAADSLMIRGLEPEAAGARAARELEAVGWGAERWSSASDSYVEVVMPLREPGEVAEWGASIVVGDEDLVTAYHAESAIDAFRDGAVVWLDSRHEPVAGRTGQVVKWDGERRKDLGLVKVAVVRAGADRYRTGGASAGPVALMSPETAETLGITSLVTGDDAQFLVRLDHDVTQADVDRAERVVRAVDPYAAIESPLMPPDQWLPVRLGLLAASLVAALTVTAIAVALGEAESRSEQRVLLAVGAPRRLRRRITAARGLVIAVLAGVLAIPAGLLPAWGVLVQQGSPIVVPAPEITMALLVLPLAAVAGGLILGRPLPEWPGSQGARH